MKTLEVRVDIKNESKVAVVETTELLMPDEQSALDIMADINWNYQCKKILFHKTNFPEEFFQLRTGLAGAILQKFTNYRVVIAIVGDFSVYDSKSLRDFIRESNKGRQVLFLSDEKIALESLHAIN